jgi:hypothetical protein
VSIRIEYQPEDDTHRVGIFAVMMGDRILVEFPFDEGAAKDLRGGSRYTRSAAFNAAMGAQSAASSAVKIAVNTVSNMGDRSAPMLRLPDQAASND